MERLVALADNPIFQYEVVQVSVIILIALLAQTIVHRYIGQVVNKVVEVHGHTARKFELQREQTLTSILRTTASLIIWAVALLLMLGVFGVNIAALATGAGLVGLVVGLGARDTIQDFVGGIFVIAENQYRVGDVISIGDKTGKVESITIRITRLRDTNGNLHVIRNGHTEPVTNMTFDYANVNINIGVSYASDVEKVKRVINEVGKKMASQPSWKEAVLEPIEFLRVESFDDTGVTIKALGKVTPGSQWDIAGEFRQQLKRAFKEHSIKPAKASESAS